MLTTKILAGPITNLTDARYFAAREVEWLLFSFDIGSENYVEPNARNAIREWVDGVKIVGEFNLMEAYEIREATEKFKLDAVQLGMLIPIETVIDLQISVPVFKEIVIENTTTPADLMSVLTTWHPFVQYFVLNFTKNAITWAMLYEGNPLSVHFLTKLCEKFSLMFAIDLQSEVLNDMMNMLLLSGIYVKGGVEEKIGYKSFEELDEIFDLLENRSN